MKKLDTIQKEHKLNDVFALDEPGPGGACHHYAAFECGTVTLEELPKCIEDDTLFYEGEIHFRRGPRSDPDSNSGLTDVDLLEIVRDRLTDFQRGPFACQANADALNHVTAALMALDARTQDHAERGVLGRDEA